MSSTHDSGSPGDPAELRKKYLAERDKRLRPDADGQYFEATGVFEDFVKDPLRRRAARAQPVERRTSKSRSSAPASAAC